MKLDFVSKEWLAKLDKQTFADMCVERAKTYYELRVTSYESGDKGKGIRDNP